MNIGFGKLWRGKTWIAALAAGLLLMACSSVPRHVRGDVDTQVTLSALRAQSVPVQGQLVRWGGLIARVQNKENQSWIEIVEKPLDRSGRPSDANVTNGRFMAIVDQFLDPMIYAQGREITVVGALQPSINGKIDEQDYQYFVVAATGYHLWKERPIRDYDRVYFRYHSWWDPWWYSPVFIYRGPYYYDRYYHPHYYYDRHYRGEPRIVPRERARNRPATEPRDPPGQARPVIKETGPQIHPRNPDLRLPEKATGPQIHPREPQVTPPQPPRVQPRPPVREEREEREERKEERRDERDNDKKKREERRR